MTKSIFITIAATVGISLAAATLSSADAADKSGYADVNGVKMYYEITGTGQPLVLLHGAFMNIDNAFGKLIPTLAKDHRVIAVELQGHGRTADIDRPLTYEQLADDVVALMKDIGVGQADIFGYSLGGGVALQVAIRHPAAVRKLVIASASYNSGGWRPGLLAFEATMTADMFAGSPWEADYKRLAADPDGLPKLVEKVKTLDTTVQDWLPDTIKAIKAPALIIVGDSDGVSLQHAADLFRLLGGDVLGDFAGLPRSRLAVLPAATHVGLIQQTDLLLAIVPPFLDAPMPEAK